MPAQESQDSVNQFLELILQLKKTTPAAAKQILNGQPQIAYAVMTLLVNMNAIDVEVFSKMLTAFAQSQGAMEAPPQAQNTPIPQANPVPVITHQSEPFYNRTATPLASIPAHPLATQPPNPYSNGYQLPQPALYGYGVPPPLAYSYDHNYNQGFGPVFSGPGVYGGYPPSQASYETLAPQQIPQQSVLSQVDPALLAALPNEERAMVARVLSMTPEMIDQLSPQDQTNIMRLRATLGL